MEQKVVQINVPDKVGSNRSLQKSTTSVKQSSYKWCNHINIIMFSCLNDPNNPVLVRKTVEKIGSITFLEVHMESISGGCFFYTVGAKMRF